MGNAAVGAFHTEPAGYGECPDEAQEPHLGRCSVIIKWFPIYMEESEEIKYEEEIVCFRLGKLHSGNDTPRLPA